MGHFWGVLVWIRLQGFFLGGGAFFFLMGTFEMGSPMYLAEKLAGRSDFSGIAIRRSVWIWLLYGSIRKPWGFTRLVCLGPRSDRTLAASFQILCY